MVVDMLLYSFVNISIDAPELPRPVGIWAARRLEGSYCGERARGGR